MLLLSLVRYCVYDSTMAHARTDLDPPPYREPGVHLTDEHRAWFYRQVKKGHNPYKTGERLGITRSTTRRLLKKLENSVQVSGRHIVHTATQDDLSPQQIADRMDESGEDNYGAPILNLHNLRNPKAIQCWQEFGYYRHLMFNRRHIPWQIEMAQILMSWWESGQKTKGTTESGIVKGIVNTPPGGGKTTTITHDFPAWLITRDRNMRISLGARTKPQSVKYTRRLRNTLGRNVLLNVFFGRFKPLDPELWRADEFLVDGVTGHPASLEYKLTLAGFDAEDPHTIQRYEDPDDDIHEILEEIADVFLTGEKEATIMALSQDMGFLGGRFDMSLWDDLCDKNNSKTPDQRDGLVEWWDSEAESRVEPGGLLGLIGTRFGKYDLYRRNRDLTYQTDDEVEDKLLDIVTSDLTEEQMQQIREDLEKELVDKHGYHPGDLAEPDVEKGMRRTKRIYRYYKFPAHDYKVCDDPSSLRNKDHIECILDPKRFSYRHLHQIESSNPSRFALTYQQEDESSVDNLVQEVWLTGGVDEDGLVVPGCYDYDRELLSIPSHLNERREHCFSIATVDPSARNFWSIQWWIWDQEEDKDYLVHMIRERIQAGQFLDYVVKERKFSGLIHDLQLTSASMGWPISLWIIEENAAQKYLFQYRWVHEWMQQYKTHIKGHKTHANKADEEFGIETLGPRYRMGLVRLPFSQMDVKTRVVINEFKKELTEWPDALTEDMVMGHWFLHWNRWQLPSNLKVGRSKRAIVHPYGDTMPDYVARSFSPQMEEKRAISRSPVDMGHAARRRANR